MFTSWTVWLLEGRKDHTWHRVAEVLKEKVMLFALASTNPCINLNQLVFHGVSSQCHLLSESEIVPVHCVLYVCCSDSVRWIKLERLCTAVAFLDLECPNCQPFPRPLTAPRTWQYATWMSYSYVLRLLMKPLHHLKFTSPCWGVDDFHGAPNRNIGDAFLVIWRLSGAVQCCQMLSASFWERLVFKFYCSTMLDLEPFLRQLRRKTDEAGWYGSHVICRGPLSSTSQGDITVPGRNFTWIKSICQRLCSISSIVCLNCGLRWKSLQRSTSRELKHGYPTNSS